MQTKKEVLSRHIIITEQKKNLFGLMVDEVTEVLRIPEAEIRPTPELVTRIDRTYISGVIILGNRMIMLLDLAKVLSDEELSRLAEISNRHQVEGRETMEEAAERPEKIEQVSAEQG
jgi:purine-binding chemotaxis protein CheW